MTNDATTISAHELMALQKSSNVLVLDVRSATEISKTGTIPGAACIPAIDVFRKAQPTSVKFDARFSEADTIVVFCAVGIRSEAVAQTLRGLGYANVRNMSRFSEWVDAGGRVQPV